jgi:hypothetical protein
LVQRAATLGKASPLEAAAAAGRLADRLHAGGGDLVTRAALADVFDPRQLAAAMPPQPPDLVLTDVPYGRQTVWVQPADGSSRDAAGGDPLPRMVRAVVDVLADDAVIAICARARRISLGPRVPALERFRLGLRAGFIGRAGDLRATR